MSFPKTTWQTGDVWDAPQVNDLEQRASAAMSSLLTADANLSDLSSPATARVNLGTYTSVVQVVATTNITLSGTGQLIDGFRIDPGDEILATAQTNPVDNGLYVASDDVWTRAVDFPAGSVHSGFVVVVASGDTSAGVWATTGASIVVGSTSSSWQRIGPAPPSALRSQAATATGVAAINGTQTTASVTTPDDDSLHMVLVSSVLVITGNETGGRWSVQYTVGGVQITTTLHAAGLTTASSPSVAGLVLTCDPNTPVSILQDTALSSGAARAYQTISSDAGTQPPIAVTPPVIT